MTQRNWSIQNAKNHFSEVVEAARAEPQVVTKHGKPAVVIVAADEYERLQSVERQKSPNFIDHLLAMPSDGEEFERIDVELRDVEF